MSKMGITNKNALTFFGTKIAIGNRELPWLKRCEQLNKYEGSFNKDNFYKASICFNKFNKSSLNLLGAASLEENYKRNAKECGQAIYVSSLNSKNVKNENSNNQKNHYSEGNKNMLHTASKNQDCRKQQINDIEKWMNGADLSLSTRGPTHS